MAKPLEKQRAIALRRAGLSYHEILAEVPVAKATLSLWLRSVGLTRAQSQRLTQARLAAGRRGAGKLRMDRVARATRAAAEAEYDARTRIACADLLWLVGTALYWAEGTKMKAWRPSALVEFSNTDPSMLRLTQRWLQLCCCVSEDDVVYTLQIHQGANVVGALAFWERHLDVQRNRIHVYLKTHNPTPARRNTHAGYYGTLKIRVRRSIHLNRRIAGWVQGLVKHWGVG